MFIVPIDFHDGVNDLNVSANESVLFLFCMPNDTYEHMKMILNVNKNAKIVIESELRTNVHFVALMNASSHYWSSFHTNECIFSRNEQQKEYKYIKHETIYKKVIFAGPVGILTPNKKHNKAKHSNLVTFPLNFEKVISFCTVVAMLCFPIAE